MVGIPGKTVNYGKCYHSVDIRRIDMEYISDFNFVRKASLQFRSNAARRRKVSLAGIE